MQIDLKPRHLSLRYPMEVNLWGDAKTTLAALLPRLHQTTDLGWQEGIADAMRDWDDKVAARGGHEGGPDQPSPRVPHAQRAATRDAIVTADAGTTADWYGHHIRLGPT